jgi:hypothetical protein
MNEHCGPLTGKQRRGLDDPRVVQACNLLEPPLLVARTLVHLDTAAHQASHEEVLVVVAEKRHCADLREARFDIPDRLERGRRAHSVVSQT